MSKYSVIVPCYKSDQTIEKVVRLTIEEFEKLSISDYEFVLVNDCSPDEGKTIAALRIVAEKYDCVTVIDLAKNSGQHNALMAALNYATGDFIVAMDDDMQTHPSQLKKLIDEINKGYDVVYGYYPEKKHSFFKNVISKINAKTMQIMIQSPKHLKVSSYYIMTKMVKDSIITYKNSYTHIQGLILRTTKNISCIPIEHFKREVGTSTYTLKSLFRLYSSIIGFSIVPLRMCEILGSIFMIIAVLGAMFIFVQRIFLGSKMAIGWSSVMIVMLFLFGMQFMMLGLIGEYVGRIFLSLNNEPQYVVKEVISRKNLNSKESVYG